MPGGRPSSFSQEIADELCARLAHGEPLAKICDDPRMPGFSTVYRWEKEREEFRQASARARELGTHYLADECITIADEQGADPQQKKVRIDTRLRLIGKWNAKAYGDAMQLKHAGSDGQPLDLADSGAAARLAALLEAVRARGVSSGSSPGKGDEPKD